MPDMQLIWANTYFDTVARHRCSCFLMHHYQAVGAKEPYLLTEKHTAHTDHRRFIPIHDAVKNLSDEQMNILLTVCCLKGFNKTFACMQGKKKRF